MPLTITLLVEVLLGRIGLSNRLLRIILATSNNRSGGEVGPRFKIGELPLWEVYPYIRLP